MLRRRKWTLVYHRYIGYGSYVIEFRRVTATAPELEHRRYTLDCLHFIVKGWPPIGFPSGEAWDIPRTA